MSATTTITTITTTTTATKQQHNITMPLRIKECKSTLSTSSTKMKEISVIGFVSFAAVVHSHLYWVYSIIYIAYHKMSPLDETENVSIKWKSGKFQRDLVNKKKRAATAHSRTKSLTSNKSKPSVIMPSITPNKGTLVTLTATTTTTKSGKNETTIKDQQQSQQWLRAPLLQAFHTFPSSTNSSQKQEFNIHELIKSQRKLPQRFRSTGHLNKKETALPALIEVEARLSEDSCYTSTDSSSNHDLELPQQIRMTKKDRAIGLLRSTFHRSQSTPGITSFSTSSSSLSGDEQEEGTVTVVATVIAKKRKRDTILGITRKFSGRRNTYKNTQLEMIVPVTAIPVESFEVEEEETTTTKKQQQRKQLFRSLPSWKK